MRSIGQVLTWQACVDRFGISRRAQTILEAVVHRACGGNRGRRPRRPKRPEVEGPLRTAAAVGRALRGGGVAGARTCTLVTVIAKVRHDTICLLLDNVTRRAEVQRDRVSW